MADDAPRMTPAEKTKAVPAYAVELACITVGDSDRCQTFIDNHLQELPTGTLGETAPALLEVLGAKKLFSAYMPKEPTRKEFNGLIHEELDATLLSAPRITLTSYPTEATRAMPFKGENPPGRFIADTIARGLHPGVIADVTHYPELTPENPSVLTGLGLVPGNPKVVLRYAPEGFGPTGGLGSGGFGGGGVGPTGGFGGGGFRDRGRESAENTYVKWIDTDGDGVREPQFVFRNTNSGIASGSRQGETPEVHFRRTDVDGDGNLETVPFYESPPTAAQNGNPNLGIQSPIGTNVFPYADGEWTGFWEAVAVEPSADDENVLYVGFYTVARSKREVTKKVLLWKRSSLKFAETAWRADLSFNLTRQPLFLIGNGVWEGEQQIIMVRVRRLETTAE